MHTIEQAASGFLGVIGSGVDVRIDEAVSVNVTGKKVALKIDGNEVELTAHSARQLAMVIVGAASAAEGH